MNERADIKIPVETLIGIVIFVVIVLGVFTPLFATGYNFFFGSKVSELSKGNFDRLSSKVSELVDAKGNVNSSLVVSFDGTSKIAGFNYDCDKDNDPDCPAVSGNDVLFVKPKMCGLTEACLCYYKSDDLSLKKPLNCVGYNKNVVFVVKDGTYGFNGAQYVSSADKKFMLSPFEDFGTRKLDIERTESNGVVTLSFSS